jgi:hypothetical protein
MQMRRVMQELKAVQAARVTPAMPLMKFKTWTLKK